MTVSTIANAANGALQRLNNSSSNKLANSVKALIASSTSTAGSDMASLSAAASLQTQVSSLRAASLNIAQASSALEAADNGAASVSRILGRLQSLAERASQSSASERDRALFDSEFQSLRNEINRVVGSTTFRGTALLDGTVTGESLGFTNTEDNNEALGLPNLTEEALFDRASLSLKTPQASSRALDAVKEAVSRVESARGVMGEFSDALELASASVESAAFNQLASQSSVFEDDILGTNAQAVNARVQNQSQLSLLAQTNRLPTNILQLIAE